MLRRFAREEAGVVAPMVALLMMVLLGFCALVVDFGMLYANRRHLQNAADAAALAGAKELETQLLTVSTYTGPGPAAQALIWANDNGVPASGATCTSDKRATVTYNNPDPSRPYSWEVTTSRLVPLLFGPVIGIPSMCVTANAVAVVTNGAEAKLFPWAISSSTTLSPYAAPGTSQSCDPNYWDTNPYCFVLKEGSTGGAAGNFGILDFICSGSSSAKLTNYVYWAEYGYGSRPGETIPGPIPPNQWTVCTFTGNTASANSTIDDWIAATLQNPPSTCPSGPNDPTYVPDFRCPLIGLLPQLLETSLGSGSSGTVTIINFAVFELVGLAQPRNGTGHQQIVGQFLQWAAAVGPTSPQNTSAPLRGAVTIRLVQ
jgi:Flp pilus assembly protein TadG